VKRKRISMEKLREILRLQEISNLSCREIAAALNISKTVVSQYIGEFKEAKLSYLDIQSISDSDLLERIGKKKRQSERYRILESYFKYFTVELKKTGVTLYLLWQEYIAKHPNGYSHSQFCYHFQVWREADKATMHLEHKAGDKCFADFAAQKLSVVDINTGEIKEVEVFIAILAASQKTYVEAVLSQESPNFIRANENAFLSFGGVTQAIVPDNLKSGVTRPSRYEPDINFQYLAFAAHYNTIILPARSGKSRDKALVEGMVRIIYQRIFAPLRNCIFYSLYELNTAIFKLTAKHNATLFQRLGLSRNDLFLKIEKEALKPLPAQRYEFKKYAFLKVAFNYHIYLCQDIHYYSVPYRYISKKVKVTYTENSVEIFYNNIRIAYHKRDRKKGAYSTIDSHMPANHAYYASWSPERITNWADKVGPEVKKMIAEILAAKKHPEQAYRVCLGVISLEKKYGTTRVNDACARALSYGLYSYKSVKNILDKGLDRIKEESYQEMVLPIHENIRGKDYYN
jgi:transposase